MRLPFGKKPISRKSLFLVIVLVVMGSGSVGLIREKEKAEQKEAIAAKKRRISQNLIQANQETDQFLEYIEKKSQTVWRNYHQNKSRLNNPRQFEMAPGPLLYWSEWSRSPQKITVSGLSQSAKFLQTQAIHQELLKTIRKNLKSTPPGKGVTRLFRFYQYLGFSFITPIQTTVSILFEKEKLLSSLQSKEKFFLLTHDGKFLSHPKSTPVSVRKKIRALNRKTKNWNHTTVQSAKLESIHLKKSQSYGYTVGYLKPKELPPKKTQAHSKSLVGILLFLIGAVAVFQQFFSQKKKKKRKKSSSQTPQPGLPKLFETPKKKQRFEVKTPRVINALEDLKNVKQEKASFKIASQFERKALELKNPKLVKSIFVQSIAMLCESPVLYFKFDPKQGVAILEIDGGFEPGQAPASLSFDLPDSAQRQIFRCQKKGKLASLSNYPPLSNILLDRMGIACFEAWAMTQKSHFNLIGILVILHSGVKSTLNRDLIIRMMNTVSDIHEQQVQHSSTPTPQKSGTSLSREI